MTAPPLPPPVAAEDKAKFTGVVLGRERIIHCKCAMGGGEAGHARTYDDADVGETALRTKGVCGPRSGTDAVSPSTERLLLVLPLRLLLVLVVTLVPVEAAVVVNESLCKGTTPSKTAPAVAPGVVLTVVAEGDDDGGGDATSADSKRRWFGVDKTRFCHA